MAEFVAYDFADGIARITLVDAERGNPIHPAMVGELSAAVRSAQSDGARVAVLGSTGRFSASVAT